MMSRSSQELIEIVMLHGLDNRLWSSKLFSPELHKCYFLYNHKQIHSKVPILLNFVGPKNPSGDSFVSCFLTDKKALNLMILIHLIKIWLAFIQFMIWKKLHKYGWFLFVFALTYQLSSVSIYEKSSFRDIIQKTNSSCMWYQQNNT